MVDVLKSRFTGPGRAGDFTWMINQQDRHRAGRLHFHAPARRLRPVTVARDE